MDKRIVIREDIHLIKSLAFSQNFRVDEFCWQFKKPGLYAVKSGYWVARNLLKSVEELGCSEPSKQALLTHAWKINAPQKIRHLIWEIVAGHLPVTRNLVHRGISQDNHYPRCAAPYKSSNHAILSVHPSDMGYSLHRLCHR